MKTRYKLGRFNEPVTVAPGDQLNLTLTEPGGLKQKITEEITISMIVSHWVMFFVAGVGIGGMFGGPDLGEKMQEIFVEPECINDDEILTRVKP